MVRAGMRMADMSCSSGHLFQEERCPREAWLSTHWQQPQHARIWFCHMTGMIEPTNSCRPPRSLRRHQAVALALAERQRMRAKGGKEASREQR
jgi:hypothetical protein